MTGNFITSKMKILFLLVLLARAISQNIKEPLISLEWLVKVEPECRYQQGCTYTKRQAEPEFRAQSVFKNNVISKNGSDYILSEKVSSVEYSCKADYPIKWTVPFPLQVLQTSPRFVETIALRSSSVSPTGKPRNRGFESVLRLRSSWDEKFLSVNFTCESIDSQTKTKTSIHIFQRAKHKIENQGKTLEVSVDSRDGHFTFPCRPALPHFTVLLEKRITNETFKAVSSSKLNFDPKVGFTVRKDHFEDNIYGFYKCRVENETDGFVYVNVTEQVISDRESRPMMEFKSFSKKEGNAIVYNDYANDQVWCCSGVSGVRPVTMFESCELRSGDCGIRKEIFLEKVKKIEKYGAKERQANFALTKERDDCSSIPVWSSTNAFVCCKGGSLEYMDNYIYHFRPKIQNILERKGLENKTEIQLMSYDSADVVSSLSVDRKILISVGRIDNNASATKSGEQSFFDFECWRRSRTSNDTNKSRRNRKLIREFDRNHYLVGEQLTFACFAVDAIYSAGIQLRLNWKNGSAVSLPASDSCVAYIRFEGADQRRGDTVSINRAELVNQRFSQEIRADLEMESVECFAPVRNSEDWDVLKYKLDIRPAMPTTKESLNKDP